MGGATARAHSPNWVILDDAIEHHAVCGASSSCHANSNICGASSNILCNGSASDKCICDASNNCFIYDASNSILCSANDNCFIPDGSNIALCNNSASAIRYLIAAIGATTFRPLFFFAQILHGFAKGDVVQNNCLSACFCFFCVSCFCLVLNFARLPSM